MEIAALAALGAAVGALGAAFGIGGGIFIVPALVIYFGQPIHCAVASSLITIIAVSSAAAAVNVERGLANMRLGLSLEISTAAGALGGAYVSAFMPERALKLVFSFFLLAMSASMLKRGLAALKSGAERVPPRDAASGALGGQYEDAASGRMVSYGVKRLPAAAAVSVLAGAVSGLLGIGGGIIQVPLMNIVCGVPLKAAAATSNFMLGVTAASSAAVFLRRGLVPPEITAPLVIGVLGGSALGMRLLHRGKSEKLQIAFSALVLAAAIKMLAYL
ncbi:MAG: sulfite exporter TauE/SafE family protein [Elusimicrobiales bacterium]